MPLHFMRAFGPDGADDGCHEADDVAGFLEAGVVIEGLDEVLRGKMERVGDFQFLANGGKCALDKPGVFCGLEFGEVGVDDGLLFLVRNLDLFEEAFAQDRVKFVLGVVHRGNRDGPFAHLVVRALNGATEEAFARKMRERSSWPWSQSFWRSDTTTATRLASL